MGHCRISPFVKTNKKFIFDFYIFTMVYDIRPLAGTKTKHHVDPPSESANATGENEQI
jgi:hypothetical protein